MKPAEMEDIYRTACSGKGFEPSDGQFKVWKQTLGWCEKRDLSQALIWFFQASKDFPMPADLKPLAEKARLQREMKDASPQEQVEYECPQCHLPFSAVVEAGDTKPRICLVNGYQGRLTGCRVPSRRTVAACQCRKSRSAHDLRSEVRDRQAARAACPSVARVGVAQGYLEGRMKVGLIEKQWLDFRKAVFPPNLPKQQYIDLRRTFYGGMAAFIVAGSEKSEEEQSGEEFLSLIQAELMTFNEDVKANRA